MCPELIRFLLDATAYTWEYKILRISQGLRRWRRILRAQRQLVYDENMYFMSMTNLLWSILKLKSHDKIG